MPINHATKKPKQQTMKEENKTKYTYIEATGDTPTDFGRTLTIMEKQHPVVF